MDSSPSTENPVPVRDELFYFDDDPMATFLVENRLFKIHRHFFIQGSIIFRDLFAQTGGPDDPVMRTDKESDEKTIPLPDVTAKEFRTLLRFFYAMSLPSMSANKDTVIELLSFNQEDKLALLSIAHRFVFDEIFNYISQRVEHMEIPVVERIRLGDKYDLTPWLTSAYKEILDRTSLESNMRQEEIDVLGLDRVVKIFLAKTFMLRESLDGVQEAPRVHATSCSLCRNCSHWKRSFGSRRQAIHLVGLTPTADVVEKYFFSSCSRTMSPPRSRAVSVIGESLDASYDDDAF
ncbi:hypothetical protein AGABI2DRAFT_114778 [Agaricus bisporus var. bisporus H97]|uniref:hypothetical protein n=1 Tax=Agaricus bisporus var. bisporus (strain H97 / ATCC MYA-4626 / FGSC 10389) TaxID=936046 RepID=UPI00029F6295|nr:hypothetical protein AGABI2DRAFT_114778 [Agaricus bisporus var. bisporus H97]EKV49688.1 hypothetical protein AGABI2DRAFT_114778 [Agaricus bisporus var. bisporus H97]